jgi:hypothetical protein
MPFSVLRFLASRRRRIKSRSRDSRNRNQSSSNATIDVESNSAPDGRHATFLNGRSIQQFTIQQFIQLAHTDCIARGRLLLARRARVRKRVDE